MNIFLISGLRIFIATSLIVPLSLIWALCTWAIDAAAIGLLKLIIELYVSWPRSFLIISFASSIEKGGRRSCKFSSFENYNRIDPVINLKFKKQNYKIIEKAISLNKPDYIFVNTSKLLYLYKDLLLKINRKFKIILVGHDLYFFRKRYFKKINVIDKTPLRNKKELKVIKESDFIIDITHEEKKYLLSKKIDSKKIIFTSVRS